MKQPQGTRCKFIKDRYVMVHSQFCTQECQYYKSEESIKEDLGSRLYVICSDLQPDNIITCNF